ncbi:eukaryotic aspartyl protease family protein [Cryptosporidium serpentis]
MNLIFFTFCWFFTSYVQATGIEKSHRSEIIRIQLNNSNLNQYYSSIKVGPLGQKFKIIFDTGSDFLWIPSKECTSDACLNHERFDSHNSSTFISKKKHIIIRYNSGSVIVEIGQDKLMIDDFNFGIQDLGIAKDIPWNPFGSLYIDGIFGLGAVRINKIFENLEIPKMISIYLPRNAYDPGYLLLGGYDCSFIQNSEAINWFPLIKSDSWEINLKNVFFSGVSLNKNSLMDFRAIVDSGTSEILAPKEQMEYLKNLSRVLVVNKRHILRKKATFVFLDEKNKEVYFNIDLDALSFTGYSGKSNIWILGNSFIREYYSIYDYENQRVGLVPSIQKKRKKINKASLRSRNLDMRDTSK